MPPCPNHGTAFDPSVCETCAMLAKQRAARRRGLAVFAALAVPVVAAGAYLMTRPRRVPPPPERQMDQLEQDMRARLAHEPCEPKTNLNLVEHLIELDLHREALAEAYRSIGRCGVIGEMQWRVAYVQQQLHQWPAVAITTTALLDDEPRDSDFWWWRGEAWAYADLPRLALADYRQSLANSDSAQAGGFAAVRFGAPAQAASARCEGLRAWRYYVRALGGQLSQEARDDVAALTRAGTCTGEDGRGRARLPLDGMTGAARAAVTIGGVTGTFLVDPAAGTTVVSRAFAAHAGIAPAAGAERPQTFAAGALAIGPAARAATIALGGGASADGVDVIVSDEVPAGVDGVLGLSFLWHFDFGVDGAALTLAPPARDAT